VAACFVVAGIESVVFDVGGVLLDWNPRYLYRKLFSDDAAVERFLVETDLHRWHIDAR
jgi:2-haloacid dehalogenase